jgi:diphosphomevalonate decarboxylase
MGKLAGQTHALANQPTNASLSYTLDHLVSTVEVEYVPGTDAWSWEMLESSEPFAMSDKGRAKYIGFAQRLADQFGIPGQYKIRSGNSFPAACGIASSASSFAALTLAMAEIQKNVRGGHLSAQELSRLSRMGSGSSCRSFFKPWSIWKSDGAESISAPYEKLEHDVVVVSGEEKSVSSSEAHLRVSSSLLFEGRAARAERRLKELLLSFQSKDWEKSYQLIWEEFWDMHALFETSRPSFGYMNERSISVLQSARDQWQTKKDGPWITMDAGPNVHFLWRPEQRNQRIELVADLTDQGFQILGS